MTQNPLSTQKKPKNHKTLHYNRKLSPQHFILLTVVGKGAIYVQWVQKGACIPYFEEDDATTGPKMKAKGRREKSREKKQEKANGLALKESKWTEEKMVEGNQNKIGGEVRRENKWSCRVSV